MGQRIGKVMLAWMQQKKKSNSQEQSQEEHKKSPIFQVWWKFKFTFNGLLN